MIKLKCPHCDNTDWKFFQDNGLPRNHPDYTVLCVAKVKPEDWSFDEKPVSTDYDKNGLVPCGMQWEPNE